MHAEVDYRTYGLEVARMSAAASGRAGEQGHEALASIYVPGHEIVADRLSKISADQLKAMSKEVYTMEGGPNGFRLHTSDTTLDG